MRAGQQMCSRSSSATDCSLVLTARMNGVFRMRNWWRRRLASWYTKFRLSLARLLANQILPRKAQAEVEAQVLPNRRSSSRACVLPILLVVVEAEVAEAAEVAVGAAWRRTWPRL